MLLFPTSFFRLIASFLLRWGKSNLRRLCTREGASVSEGCRGRIRLVGCECSTRLSNYPSRLMGWNKQINTNIVHLYLQFERLDSLKRHIIKVGLRKSVGILFFLGRREITFLPILQTPIHVILKSHFFQTYFISWMLKKYSRKVVKKIQHI